MLRMRWQGATGYSLFFFFSWDVFPLLLKQIKELKESTLCRYGELSDCAKDEWALHGFRSWHLFSVLYEGRLIDFQTDVKGKKDRNSKSEAHLYPAHKHLPIGSVKESQMEQRRQKFGA